MVKKGNSAMSRETDKKPFNKRAFTAIMAGLLGLSLPVSGLVLHTYHNSLTGQRHAWFSAHVVAGILFVIFAGWHVILNRKALFRYFKSAGAGPVKISREARWAILIIALILILGVGHSWI